MRVCCGDGGYGMEMTIESGLRYLYSLGSRALMLTISLRTDCDKKTICYLNWLRTSLDISGNASQHPPPLGLRLAHP
jgi:hypothetical protein